MRSYELFLDLKTYEFEMGRRVEEKEASTFKATTMITIEKKRRYNLDKQRTSDSKNL